MADGDTTSGRPFPEPDGGWIESETLRRVYAYWKSLSRDGAMPRRADFDPVEVPLLLPYIYLVDVIDGGQDFKYRLVGTHITESVGFDFTGQRISEFMKTNESEDRAAAYADCLQSGMPNCSAGNLVDYGRDYMLYERLLCPFSMDGNTVDVILGGLHFHIAEITPDATGGPIRPSP